MTITMLILMAIFVGYWVAPYAIKVVLARQSLRRIRRSQAVCLTFDDGPDPRSTPRILELLHGAGASATFFMLGRQAALHPQIVRQIIAYGHEIGEHGFAHRHAWRTDPIRYAVDLGRGRLALDQLVAKQRSRLFRPAFGEINLLTLLYLICGRRRMVMWDLNPRDFDAASAADVASRVANEMGPGSVVLLHDGRAGATSDPAVTIDAVRMILELAEQRGLRLLSVSQALAHADS